MKRKCFFAAVAMLAVVALGSVALGTGRARPVAVATGNEVVEMGKYGAGEVRCIGGQPTGNPVVPCTPGTRLTLIRGLRSASHTVNVTGPAADFLDGEDVMDNSCNLDENLRGECWGTLVWTIPGKGGKWEGTWSGRFDIMASTASYSARMVGRGGELEGLHLQYDAVAPGWSGAPGVSPPNPIVFIVELGDR